jgi:hypothetical protein
MIDPFPGETLILFKDAAKRLPVTRQCLLRWVRTGVKARDGSRVKLQAKRVGWQWVTSEERLAAFQAAIDKRPDCRTRTPLQRQRDHERATQELIKMGV